MRGWSNFKCGRDGSRMHGDWNYVKMAAHLIRLRRSPPICPPHRFSQVLRPSAMQANSQGRGDVISTLHVTIEALYLAREVCSIIPAKAAFSSVVALLSMIKVCPLRTFGYGSPGSCFSRSRRSMNRTASTWGYPAPKHAKLSTKG